MPIESGSYWVSWADRNAQNSTSLDDLSKPFQANARAFIKALEDAGAKVEIGTTLRAAKRAYLFHWCWLIGLGKIAPSRARPRSGVDILWDHGDKAASIAGAKEMIAGFRLAVPPRSTEAPSLTSAHIRGEAVDMTITWTGTLALADKRGRVHRIAYMDNVNRNDRLHAVGATYGVRKLRTDAPHWSLNGN